MGASRGQFVLGLPGLGRLGAVLLLLGGLLAMHGFWSADLGAEHHSSPTPSISTLDGHVWAQAPTDGASAGVPAIISETDLVGGSGSGEVLLSCLIALSGIVRLLAAHRRRAWHPRVADHHARRLRPGRWPALVPRLPRRDLMTTLCVLRV